MKYIVLFLILAFVGCKETKVEPKSEHKHAPASQQKRIAIPASVRKNLGITFVAVERRRIQKTLRFPGHFEVPPHARRQYRSIFPGRVEILVQQYQKIEPKEPLYRIHSERWYRIQQELLEADSAVSKAQSAVKIAQASLAETNGNVELTRKRILAIKEREAVNEEHTKTVNKAWELWQERVTQLEKLDAAGGGRANELAMARSELATARKNVAEVKEEHLEIRSQKLQLENEAQTYVNSLPRLQAELEAREHEYQSALAKWQVVLSSTASLLNIPVSELTQVDPHSKLAAWQAKKQIEVLATEPGIIEKIYVNSGTSVAETELLLSTISPDELRFRATALQSDMSFLQEGLSAQVVPSSIHREAVEKAIAGKISLVPEANRQERTIDIVMKISNPQPWARPEVSAYLEVLLDASARPELAIPVSCLIQDGLEYIFFRRAPNNPDEAIRIVADLGLSDGRWVAVKSGITDSDEVVLHGVYELKLSTSGSNSAAGHFDADGTFHTGSH